MVLSIVGWSLLIVIGVSDAKEHRIPNSLVVTLLLIILLETFIFQFNDNWTAVFLDSLFGFLMCFGIGVLIYVSRVMAAGDVKLLAAIGLSVGMGSLAEYAQFVILSCILVGFMYLTLNRIDTVSLHTKKREQYGLISDNKISYMPLAPVFIISLAMFQYFSLA
ncbi:A24 family peptidase [Vibrio sp. H11]|uniref:prepilin peptidase n=1 Tax=Vibrio sp. H11 TaxID=2565928 RepID=UPI0010A641FB|nr:A24 family peptidase [Vibrio sp. H11]